MMRMSDEQNPPQTPPGTDDEFFDGPEVPSAESGVAFVVDLAGYEGPIDVLLTLAREQKVDITQISILALADQYLAFVAEARQRDLELAADYLVMAAWLAYLKSRLLLPDLSEEDEPTGAEMAAALQFQLQRLEAMQQSGQGLMARPRLGDGFFRRGAPELPERDEIDVLDCSLYDLLKAYGEINRRRNAGEPLKIEPFRLHTVDEALKRLARLVGRLPDWESLWQYLPEALGDETLARSAIASTFTASLEMAREGQLQLRQAGPFGPIFLRSPSTAPKAVDGADKPENDAR